MNVSVTLQKKVMDFLKSVPNLANPRSREAFIYSAGLDSQLTALIVFEGPSAQFIPLLVRTLLQYGTLQTGQPALQAILEAAKNYIGNDKQDECSALLQELSPNGNHAVSPKQEAKDRILEQYELLAEQLHRLRMDRIIETETLRRFKIEKQIEQIEAELKQLEQQAP